MKNKNLNFTIMDPTNDMINNIHATVTEGKSFITITLEDMASMYTTKLEYASEPDRIGYLVEFLFAGNNGQNPSLHTSMNSYAATKEIIPKFIRQDPDILKGHPVYKGSFIFKNK